MEFKDEKEAIRAAQREHARKWREANPEKNRELQRRYWLRKAEKLAQAEREREE